MFLVAVFNRSVIEGAICVWTIHEKATRPLILAGGLHEHS